jgi:hypothetical protein
MLRQSTQFVMPGLVPGIHVFKTVRLTEDVDGRNKSGHGKVHDEASRP